MPTIAEVRQKFPQYNDMSDTDLAGALHKKFYSDMPVEEFNAKIGLKTEAPKPETGGYWSEIGKAYNPIEIAKEVGRTGSEGIDTIQEAFKKPRGEQGVAEGLLNTGKAALGATQVAFSPLIGIPRNIGGHTMTGLQMLAHKAAQAFDPKLGDLDPSQEYESWRGDIDKAMMAARPAGGAYRMPNPRGAPDPGLPPPRYEIPPERKAFEWANPDAPPPPQQQPPPLPPETPPGHEAAMAAQRLRETNPDLTLPRAVTGTPSEQQLGQMLSRQPLAGGQQILSAIEKVPEQLGETRTAVADKFGTYRTPTNVAGDIGEHLGGAAKAETEAAQTAARQADEAARIEWERTHQAREQTIADAEAQSARETTQQVGTTHPTDAGNTAIDTVRANHDAVRDRKNALYREAGQREGTIYDQSIGQVDRHVNLDLQSDRGGRGRVTIRERLTPAAHDMQAELEAFSQRARQRRLEAEARASEEGHGQPDQTGVSLREIETQRQILGDMAQAAKEPADQRAVGRIMDAFDSWQARAMRGSHYEGDPEALPSLLRARAANRDYRERFGYNAGNDADKIINKMVRGERGEHIGPNDVSNILHGPRGNRPDRFLERLYEATGDHPNHPNVVQAVRGGFWDKLTEGPAGRHSERITNFLDRSHRDLAGAVFTPEDQALMRRHAAVLDTAERAREQSAAMHRASEPAPTKVEKGPLQQLSDRVLGSKGQKRDEALYDTIEGYAKSKSRKDLRTLSELMGQLPADLKGSFLNTFIRRLGTGRDGTFSPTIFHKEWGNITPETKMAMTGGSGEHVRALDDIATVSKHFDDVHKHFGNPSGSGHVITAFQSVKTIATLALTHGIAGPLYAVGTWMGGVGASRFLATPQGAASLARFATRLQRLQEKPTVSNAAAAKLAATNVRNTALSLGISTKIPKSKD